MTDNDKIVVATLWGLMGGSLFGWLAPTLVAAFIIIMLTVWVIEPMIFFRDRYAGYPVNVKAMMRQW